MINITKPFLEFKFKEFNTKYFNGELKPTKFVISNNRSRYGQFRPRTWTIEISTAYIRSEKAYYNTLLHEMAHCYVRQKYGQFAKSHGYEWKSVAEMLNKKTNGMYGTIQRIGGIVEKKILRNPKDRKYVVFTDYNNRLSIGCYNDDTYVDKLLSHGGVNTNYPIYYFISGDNDLQQTYKMRKARCKRLYYNHLTKYTLDELQQRATLINTEQVLGLHHAG